MKKKIFLTLTFIIFAVAPLFADPGQPCDPDACPLDTWVMALAAAALIPTTIFLSRKQKAADLAA